MLSPAVPRKQFSPSYFALGPSLISSFCNTSASLCDSDVFLQPSTGSRSGWLINRVFVVLGERQGARGGQLLYWTGGHLEGMLWLKCGIKWKGSDVEGCPVALLGSPGRLWELKKDSMEGGGQLWILRMWNGRVY